MPTTKARGPPSLGPHISEYRESGARKPTGPEPTIMGPGVYTKERRREKVQPHTLIKLVVGGCIIVVVLYLLVATPNP